jgi:hypothetical protein
MGPLVGVFVLFAALLITSVSSASSLTTTYGANNNGSPGGAIYFDATVGLGPITVTGFDTNTNSLSPFELAVYRTAPGSTAFGNESNQSAWVVVATGSGFGAGLNQPSAVNLTDFFTLQANTTYGIALVFTSLTEHHYTNGTASNLVYFNSDLTISNGSASNSPFGAAFSPRVWNGTIYYSTGSSEGAIPEPSTVSMMLLAGAWLLLAQRRRTLSRN